MRISCASIVTILALSSSAGCSSNGSNGSSGGSSAPTCIDGGVDTSCTPSYEPTYDALYTKTFKPSCAASGVSCHAATGQQGGVDFDDPEAAYAALTQSKLLKGKPECSILVSRVVATDGKIRMPPGRSLSVGEQCAIIKWIAEGAKR